MSDPRQCVGCGGIHGPVNHELECLRRELLSARGQRDRLRNDLRTAASALVRVEMVLQPWKGPAL
jgi:hypothetical protein